MPPDRECCTITARSIWPSTFRDSIGLNAEFLVAIDECLGVGCSGCRVARLVILDPLGDARQHLLAHFSGQVPACDDGVRRVADLLDRPLRFPPPLLLAHLREKEVADRRDDQMAFQAQVTSNRKHPDMNIGTYKVISSVAIGDATYALAGIVEGEVPDVGTVGVGVGVTVEVLGIGVVDPNLVARDKQGLLVKVVSGEEKDLIGATFEFPRNRPKETDRP